MEKEFDHRATDIIPKSSRGYLTIIKTYRCLKKNELLLYSGSFWGRAAKLSSIVDGRPGYIWR
jgi:hypothetical protein